MPLEIINFNFNDAAVENTKFYIAIDNGNDEDYFNIEIDNSVNEVLISILGNTLNEFKPKDKDNNDSYRRFEVSEKYGAEELLYASLKSEEFKKLKRLYDNATNIITVSSNILEKESNSIIYYFAKFTDNYDRKIIGVRRASQFKGFLSGQNRLIRWLDDSLKTIDFNIFRLDRVFDFILTLDNIYILNPASLEFIADLSSVVSEKARERARSLSNILNFLSFDSIADFASHNNRAARLLAAISIRNDINEIKKDKLIEAANINKIELENINGDKIKPKIGNEIALLELLDNRRYIVSLTDDAPCTFRANSRKQI
jgi:hypothetical protein